MSTIKLGSFSFNFDLFKKEEKDNPPSLDLSMNLNASITKPLADTLAIGFGKPENFLFTDMIINQARNLLTNNKGGKNVW